MDDIVVALVIHHALAGRKAILHNNADGLDGRQGIALERRIALGFGSTSSGSPRKRLRMNYNSQTSAATSGSPESRIQWIS